MLGSLVKYGTASVLLRPESCSSVTSPASIARATWRSVSAFRRLRPHASAERVHGSSFVGAMLRDASAGLHHDEDNPKIGLARQRARGMTVTQVGVFRSQFRVCCRKIKDGHFGLSVPGQIDCRYPKNSWSSL